MFLGLEYDDEERRSRFPEGNMRKQELVHLHGLLAEITEWLVDAGAVSATTWEEYEALEVDSYSINAQKREHEEAVLLLATTLSATVEQPTEEQSSISVS